MAAVVTSETSEEPRSWRQARCARCRGSGFLQPATEPPRCWCLRCFQQGKPQLPGNRPWRWGVRIVLFHRLVLWETAGTALCGHSLEHLQYADPRCRTCHGTGELELFTTPEEMQRLLEAMAWRSAEEEAARRARLEQRGQQSGRQRPLAPAIRRDMQTSAWMC